MRISISFKNNKLEKDIYDHLQTKLNFSVYIKELILADMRRNGQEEVAPTRVSETTSSSMDYEF